MNADSIVTDTTSLAGTCPLDLTAPPVSGGPVEIPEGRSYEIRNYDGMKPFLMTIAGSGDHWMYLSSTGGLTCGRRSPDQALFPYYTDDKIHDAVHTTGPVTVLRVADVGVDGGAEGSAVPERSLAGSDGSDGSDDARPEVRHLWKPFSDEYRGIYRITRTLYKRLTGDLVVFEERNETLGLAFRYSWRFSGRYGFVREATVRNLTERRRRIEVLDGLRNILPAGVDRPTQERASTLVDAYKLAEVVPDTDLAVYSMSSLITDRAEPSEGLRASVAWHTGLEGATVLVSEEQIAAFTAGTPVAREESIRGRRGAYLVCATVELAPAGTEAGTEVERKAGPGAGTAAQPGAASTAPDASSTEPGAASAEPGAASTEPDAASTWTIVADTDRDTVAVADLEWMLRQTPVRDERRRMILDDIAAGEDALQRRVARTDGLQYTADTMTRARHYSNALFNIMRGGIPVDGYTIGRDDLLSFIESRNGGVADAHRDRIAGFDATLSYTTLLEEARRSGDPHLERLVLEYLPLTFSRRHGDPSRPWNKFSIEIENPDGSPRLAWQGNWRDIFQNWEALALSYPGYLPGMVAVFLNASTADGYNPYRISREGIDWEVFDPEDPWSNIGYWGDHQIVYLYRLLELLNRHQPGMLEEWLARPVFASAEVPYRIKRFDEIVANPYESITFDDARAARIDERVATVGADGKLLHREDRPDLVSLTEKLLVTILTKLSNYVPDGGIWMNTQRPEWNDANNALAGWGVSVVTMAYLYRMIDFLLELIPADHTRTAVLRREVVTFLDAVGAAITVSRTGETPVDATVRWEVLSALGRAGSAYRETVYDRYGEDGAVTVSCSRVREVLAAARNELTASLATNRRDDGLYHSYNVLHLEGERATIRRLPEMLEGQVAVLASGILTETETTRLLESLASGPLYRGDADSFTLYPNRRLPSFLEKNRVDERFLSRSPWLLREAERRDGRILRRDRAGTVRFNAAFRNARDLTDTLDGIVRSGGDHAPTTEDREYLLEVYESVFHHRGFTGRSGTFFKYEGLGSIYWHMVSKLNIAILEAIRSGHTALAGWFHRVKEGIGSHKSPVEYGAFPFDPYSHTPEFIGAQQPGMTGQVKEDLIARFGELGVEVVDGSIRFRPRILKKAEFAGQDGVFRYLDLSDTWRGLPVPAGSVAFTCCQVPVVYRRNDLKGEQSVIVTRRDGRTETIPGDTLDPVRARALFERTGEIARIDVGIDETVLI
jgi:hypothetical protein